MIDDHRVGRDRAADVRELIAAAAPRPVWPMYSPTGSAIAVARRRPRPRRSARCSSSRVGIPVSALPVGGVVSQAMTSFTGIRPPSPARARAAHGVSDRSTPDEHEVGDERQQHGQDRAEARTSSGRSVWRPSVMNWPSPPNDVAEDRRPPSRGRSSSRSRAGRRRSSAAPPAAARRGSSRSRGAVAHAVGRLEDLARDGLRSPATMFRTRISSVYVVSGITAVSSESPKIGTSSANAARLGIV